MRLNRFLVSLFVLCVSLGAVGRAAAQGSDGASAEALFRAGREAMDRGDYAAACQRFAESNRLDPAVGAVFNLGACKEKLNRLAEAWQYFREVIDRLPPDDPRVAIAKARVEAIESRLARLRLTLASEVPDAVVVKDGVLLQAGSLGVALPVDPGDHRLTVRAPGRQDKTIEVTLREGETRDIALEPGEVSAALTAGSEVRPSSAGEHGDSAEPASGDKTLSYVAIGVGVAGLVLSAISGAVVLSKKSTVEEHCPDKQCDQEGFDAGSTGRLFSTIGTVSFAVGAVALGTGIVLLTTSGGSEDASSSARAAPNGLVCGRRPAGGLTGALATVRGRF